MCLTRPFLPFFPGPGFPEVPLFPSSAPSGNQIAEGPHLRLPGSHRVLFLLLYLRCLDPARPIPHVAQVSPALKGPRAKAMQEALKERHHSTWDTGKLRLWGCPHLQDPDVPGSMVLAVPARGTSLWTVPQACQVPRSSTRLRFLTPASTSQQTLLVPTSQIHPELIPPLHTMGPPWACSPSSPAWAVEIAPLQSSSCHSLACSLSLHPEGPGNTCTRSVSSIQSPVVMLSCSG